MAEFIAFVGFVALFAGGLWAELSLIAWHQERILDRAIKNAQSAKRKDQK